ncbi:MAG TPA: DNA adenine methylase [Methanolinea sp.]|nr:DNA adenine methylase [Methanolinea sp.]HQK55157.1 DNA adenine methylase [Methanolinea sp.]
MGNSPAKPFLKWAGGKTQLLEEFTKRIPDKLKRGELPIFIEPFVGGGAVFFHFNTQFTFDECHIFDINEELVLAYNVVKNNVDELIELLQGLEKDFLSKDETERKLFYYQIRDEFNRRKSAIHFHSFQREWIERTSQLIFLNRTCFNGLYRVNSQGEFNVPFGRYKKPKILNDGILKADSEKLQNTEIHLGDFAESYRYISDHSFVYFDPPYRPLNGTSFFTQYSRNGFSDLEQKRLAAFFERCDAKQAKLMLSNSDPKNVDPGDDFFDVLYAKYHITRVPAKRMINCDGTKRGEIKEIIVTNY